MRQLPLGEKWPAVRRGLERIIAKTGCKSWIPEDVYAAVLNQQAYLFEIGTGFAVVQVNRGPSGPFLFVWCLYMPPGNDRDAVVRDVDALAVQAGCDPAKTQFNSTRVGWTGFLEGYFQPVATIYERVNYGSGN